MVFLGSLYGKTFLKCYSACYTLNSCKMNWDKVAKVLQVAIDLLDVYTKHKGQNINNASSSSQSSNSSKK